MYDQQQQQQQQQQHQYECLKMKKKKNNLPLVRMNHGLLQLPTNVKKN